MATILTDDFETYSLGDLNGQGSWSGDTQFQVQSSIVVYGSQGIAATAHQGANKLIQKLGTIQSAGKQTVYMRVSASTADVQRFRIFETGIPNDNMAAIAFYNGNISTITGETLSTYSINTWYCLVIEWRSSPDHKVRYSADGGNTFTSWLAPFADWTSGIDNVEFAKDDATSDINVYWDYLAENRFTVDYTLITAVGAFILTGINIILLKAHNYIISLLNGIFNLTGINIILEKTGSDWTNQSKSGTSSFTNQDKHFF